MKFPLRLAVLLVWATSNLSAQDLPNIVVIMADDLGYGDVSCYDPRAVPTPNIDRIAAEGLRFTSGYSSASTCTPTRYSLLTGTYAFRVKGTGVAAPNAPALIAPGTPTIASLLRQRGYATAVVGKWHLGLGDGFPDWNGELQPGPLEIGFEHCLLLPTTNDRVPSVLVEDHRVRNLDPRDPLWVGDHPPNPEHPTGKSHRAELTMDWSVGHQGTIHNGISRIGFFTGGQSARFRDQDLADEWVRAANAWIETHTGQPFFLFLASHDIHVPRTPHERFGGKSGTGPRGDAVLEFDWTVGEIAATLARCGLADRTLLLICSDNGPVLDDGYQDQAGQMLGEQRPTGPFSGGKYTVREGGTRTPFIVRWTGRIQPGVSEHIISTIDLGASLAALTGAELPPDGFLDSFNLRGALLGETNGAGREYVLQQDNEGKKFGLRAADWKLVRQTDSTKAGSAEVHESLYYLVDDPTESTDVAERYPAEFERLRNLLKTVLQSPRTREP